MILLRITFLLCGLLIATFARLSADTRPTTVSPALAGTVLRTLPNGLRLLVREQHGTSLVSLDLWVRAGSGREDLEEGGAAHFLEHLIFKGTPTHKPGEIDAAIEDLGASLNATTNRDAAHFYTTVAAPYLPDALEVLADALRNPLLAHEEVERERRVILDEMARSRNDLHKQTLNDLYRRLYARHPYRRPILGSPDELRTITRETILGFYRRHYLPNNTTLVLVGDITPEAAEALAVRCFGTWAKGFLPLTPPDETSLLPDTRPLPSKEDISSSDGSAAVGIGFRVMGSESAAEVAAAEVVSVILDDDLTGRLTEKLKRAGLASEIAADFVPLRFPGIFACYAACDPTRLPPGARPRKTMPVVPPLDNIRRILNDELQRLRTEPVSAEELVYAKRRLLGTFLYDIETCAGQARMLGYYDCAVSPDGYKRAMEYPDAIAKVSAADVQKFARRFLDNTRRVDTTRLPEKP